MGRTVVEPVTVMLCFCAAVVAAGAAVVDTAAVWAGAAVAGTVTAAVVAAGAAVVLLLVHPATNIDTIRSAARHTVPNTHELRFVLMVFDHEIPGSKYTVFRHRLYKYIFIKETNRGINRSISCSIGGAEKHGNSPGPDDRGVIVRGHPAKRVDNGDEDKKE